jgi:hypothetical protein
LKPILNENSALARRIFYCTGLITAIAAAAATASFSTTVAATAAGTTARSAAATAATITTAAAAKSAAATAARSTGPALFARSGFIDFERASFDFFAVQGIDRSSAFILVRHLNEAETTRLAGELIFDHSYRRNLTISSERSAEFFFTGGERQVTNVDIHHSLLNKKTTIPSQTDRLRHQMRE